MIDIEGFPYGNKELSWLKERIIKLVNESKTDNVIIACNTLSSIIYFFTKQNYQHIYILATKNTAKMDVYSKLFKGLITYIDASDLIEAIQFGDSFQNELYDLLQLIKDKNSPILLGCTHLIKIKRIIRKKVENIIISQDEIFVDLFR